ncbi:hypothetical protein V2J09_005744 [Rumex salicifolius]
MGSTKCSYTSIVGFLLLSASLHLEAQQQSLQSGFYSQTCQFAEYIIKDEVRKGLLNDMGLAAGLGCDASVLIDSTPSNKAEKDSPPNFPSLRGFEIIDNAKARLEAMCPGVVSCADILAYAARDATENAGGIGYDVPAGRRDGRISKDSEAFANLPPPFGDLKLLTQIFGGKGLTQEDMVVLSGAHTIGRSHCTSVTSRLYNFSANAAQDPSLDSTYGARLRQQCPYMSNDNTSVVPMDPPSPNMLDVSYYKGIMTNRGLLTSDQTLMSSTNTTSQVKQYANNPYLWQQKFANAMVKMGQIGVLTGNAGEIRANCRVIN